MDDDRIYEFEKRLEALEADTAWKLNRLKRQVNDLSDELEELKTGARDASI